MLQAMEQLIPNASITGIDLMPMMAQEALATIKRVSSNNMLHVIVADVHGLPFKNESFQLVTSIAGLLIWDLSPSWA